MKHTQRWRWKRRAININQLFEKKSWIDWLICGIDCFILFHQLCWLRRELKGLVGLFVDLLVMAAASGRGSANKEDKHSQTTNPTAFFILLLFSLFNEKESNQQWKQGRSCFHLVDLLFFSSFIELLGYERPTAPLPQRNSIPFKFNLNSISFSLPSFVLLKRRRINQL